MSAARNGQPGARKKKPPWKPATAIHLTGHDASFTSINQERNLDEIVKVTLSSHAQSSPLEDREGHNKSFLPIDLQQSPLSHVKK
jgi:hypothetical protein